MYAEGDDAGASGLAETELQDYARRHPMRVAILALLSSKRQPERTVDDLCSQLPNTPSRAVVEYHLKALRTVGLVSEQRKEGAAATYGLV